MTGPWYLGNDVVDLNHHGGLNKAMDERFLARVCSPEEAAVVRSSLDPDVALWVLWAGKESIYKSTSKALGSPPVFHHPRFQVGFPETDLSNFLTSERDFGNLPLIGTGSYGDLSFRILVEKTESSVHAISWIRGLEREDPYHRAICRKSELGTRGPATGLEANFSDRELDCVTHRASALTRIQAREDLARTLGIPESSLEIGCGPGSPGRRVPEVRFNGEELPVDLSLSHHGRFLAWVFLYLQGPASFPSPSMKRGKPEKENPLLG